MAQLNLAKTTTFEIPPVGKKGYGIDVSGNPVIINEDGSTTPISTIVSSFFIIQADLGVGLVADLPESANEADVYVTSDTLSIYTMTSGQWVITAIPDNQYVFDSIVGFLYFYSDGFLINLTNVWGFIDGDILDQTDLIDYINSKIAGLLDYRGSFDISGNVFPSTGGSGTAGAILKGDSWVAVNAGVLDGEAVNAGDFLIANIDSPGQTGTNWDILNNNLSFTPENVANKRTTFQTTPDDTHYPSEKLVKDSLDSKLSDANSDGKTYGRKNGAWAEIVPIGDAAKVGTGQTYETIGAAVTAGKKLIEITSNITETGNIALSDGTIIFSLATRTDYVVNMGAYSFTTWSNCKFDSFTLSFQKTAAGQLFTHGGGSIPVILDNMYFTNTSTVDYGVISTVGIFNDCKINLPNRLYCGIGNAVNGFTGILSRVEFVGTGSSCGNPIANSNTIMIDCSLSGTFINQFTLNANTIKGLTSYLSTSVQLNAEFILDARMSSQTASKIGISPTTTYVFPSKVVNSNIEYIYCTNNSYHAEFTNCSFTANLTLDTNAGVYRFTNCNFNGTLTLQGQKQSFDNCYFYNTVSCSTGGYAYAKFNNNDFNGNVTVSSDGNIFMGNRVGIGGLSVTITFNSGADNNICVGNQTDLAIVNNGTGNQLAYNLVI